MKYDCKDVTFRDSDKVQKPLYMQRRIRLYGTDMTNENAISEMPCVSFKNPPCEFPLPRTLDD